MKVRLVTEDESTQVTAALTGKYQASDWRQFGSQDRSRLSAVVSVDQLWLAS
jgi:hypothetical protein